VAIAYLKAFVHHERKVLVDGAQVFGEAIKYVSYEVRVEERHPGIEDLRDHHFVDVDRRLPVEAEESEGFDQSEPRRCHYDDGVQVQETGSFAFGSVEFRDVCEVLDFVGGQVLF
jgi:hypothetical protein